MKAQNNVSLHNLLEQLPTSDLDDMLHNELEKEFPNEHTVQLILMVLRKREDDYPLLSNQEINEAWEKYQKKITRKSVRMKQPLVKAAAVLILCSLLLVTLPQKAQAESFFDWIVSWTDSIFDMFGKWDRGNKPKEYVFQTDHLGLQELYNKVVELGVTTPVVPMWLAEGYMIEQCDTLVTPNYCKVIANFSDGEKETVYELIVHLDSVLREFHKDELDAEEYEIDGTIHYIFRNNESWMVVWARDNIQCSLFIECQEDILYQILDSIYTKGE